MRVIDYTKRILPLLILVALFASCGDDLTGGLLNQNEDDAPSAGLIAEGGFVLGSADVETGETFKVKLSASSGTASLRSVTIKEDGDVIDLSRIAVDGVPASANPILLFSPDTESFIWEIEVVAHEDESAKSYTFEVADELDLKSDVTVTISTMAQAPIAPSLEYLGAMSVTVDPGSIISIPLNVMAGNRPLSHIAVSEGPDFIEDLSRLSFGDESFTANPHPLEAADQNGFEKNIFIKVSDEPGTKMYRVFVVDGHSEGAFVDIAVTTGTPINLIEGILFNAAGVAGTGGLDLDDGTGLGSMDLEAEIKDEGIDLDLAASQNWRQQISGVNGAEMKYVIPGQNGISEGFSFDGVTLKEEVSSAFENGVMFDLRNEDNELSSYQVGIGDVFAVHSQDRYYLIKISEINVVSNGNADHYVIDIKQ